MKIIIRTLIVSAVTSLLLVSTMPAGSNAGTLTKGALNPSFRVLESIHQNYLASLRSKAIESNGLLVTNEITAGPAKLWLTKVNAKNVNMVTNRLDETNQIVVSMGGKEYYVANKAYELNLKMNPSLRTAIDPFTNKAVDKSEALIYADASGRAFYFESQDSFEGFISQA